MVRATKKQSKEVSSVETCVNNMLNQLGQEVELNTELTEKFRKIMLDELNKFSAQERSSGAVETMIASSAEQQQAPAQPKLRHVNPYQLFVIEWNKNNKNLPQGERFTKQGADWKAVTPEQLAMWTKRAEEENERLRQAYIAQHGSLPQKPTKPERKRSTNAFQLFLVEYRKKHSETKNVFSVAGKEWAGMSEKQKKKYQDQAKKQQEAFNKEWAEKLKANPELENQLASKKKKKVREGPVRHSGYMLYGAELRSKKPKDGVTVSMKMIGEAWQKLSKDEKAKYEEQAVKLNQEENEKYAKAHPAPATTSTTATTTTPVVAVASS